VEDVTKQDMIDFMGSLRKQPLTTRRNSNPDRTYANKGWVRRNLLEDVWCEQAAQESEYPQYEEKMVTAHPNEELEYLYARADAEQRFLLDFALNSGFRTASFRMPNTVTWLRTRSK